MAVEVLTPFYQYADATRLHIVLVLITVFWLRKLTSATLGMGDDLMRGSVACAAVVDGTDGYGRRVVLR